MRVCISDSRYYVLLFKEVYKDAFNVGYQVVTSTPLEKMLTLYILLTVVCLLVIKYVFQYIEFRKTYNKLPGRDDFHPILGDYANYPGFNDAGQMWDFGNVTKFKDFMRVWIGPFLAVIQVFHPDTIRQIVKSTSTKPRSLGLLATSYDMGIRWLGEGLILTNGSRWARNRRMLTPAFHFDILKNYMKFYNSCSDIFENKIQEMSSKGESFDLDPLVSKLTLDIILRCACSYQSDCQTELEPSEYAKAISEIQYTWAERALNPFKHPEFIFKWLPEGRRFYHLCEVAHKEAESVIENRKKEIESNGGDVSSRKVRDFLDTLLTARDEEGKGLSLEEIRDEVDTFMFAGHDTTASGIMWTLLCLAQHPAAQEDVWREVRGVLGGRTEVAWEDLPKLQWTSQCIKEGLRLHTTVPAIERITTEDVWINEHRVPEGTRVTLHLWMLHHNPHLWHDPLTFNPARFDPDKVTAMDPFQFLPFSAGARNCIGQNFAMNEMKVTVAKLIQRFRLSADPERPAKHRMSITMKAEDGCFVYASERDAVDS